MQEIYFPETFPQFFDKPLGILENWLWGAYEKVCLKFEPSGTHVHKGKLKIRVDVFPRVAHKMHARQYFLELNPMLGHFIIIDAGATRAEIRTQILSYFDNTTLDSIDNAIDGHDISSLRQTMNSRLGSGAIIPTGQEQTAVDNTNTLLEGLEVEI